MGLLFDMITQTKTCTKCDTTKTVDRFYKNKSKKDGLQSQCKTCAKGYKETNREEIRAKQKAYHEANLEEIRARKKAYREANREKIMVKDKAYREANREVILAKKKSYHEANREKILAKKKTYREANPEKIMASNLEYRRNRLINDPIYRQIHNTRSNLGRILHGTGSHQPTLDLLGCTGQEWRDHLESLWTEGMSWDNYGHGKGKWQCDHIIPVSAFDQTDPEQQKECWNYLNTQPLWAEDNMAKGSTIPKE